MSSIRRSGGMGGCGIARDTRNGPENTTDTYHHKEQWRVRCDWQPP